MNFLEVESALKNMEPQLAKMIVQDGMETMQKHIDKIYERPTTDYYERTEQIKNSVVGESVGNTAMIFVDPSKVTATKARRASDFNHHMSFSGADKVEATLWWLEYGGATYVEPVHYTENTFKWFESGNIDEGSGTFYSKLRSHLTSLGLKVE